MKKNLLVITLLLTNLVTSQNQKEYAQLKQTRNTSFIKNEGQIIDQNGNQNKGVLYLLNANGLKVQLKKSGFSYDVYERDTIALNSKTNFQNKHLFHNQDFKKNNDSLKVESSFHRIDFEFLDINEDVVIKEYNAVLSFSNYYNIPNKQEGISNVKSFKKIVYENLYEGINLEFFVPENINKPVEYNFIIEPIGDISNIKMKISGAEVKLINNALNMKLIYGDLNEIIPKSWIKNNDKQKEVTVNYSKQGENIFGFQIKTKNYNKNSTLVIDPTPVRSWATYFGGSEDESSFEGDVESDSNGNMYLSGYTQSDTNIATSGSHQSSIIQYPNAYLAKFNSCGTIIWSTYYGGGGSTIFSDITVDYLDNIIAVGQSASSTNISTTGTYQEHINDSSFGDGIIVKFNSNGVRLWGTYFGGESAEAINSVKTDINQNIYFGGTTASNNNIATVGAFKEIGNVNVHYNWDAFLGKIDKNGILQWASYYGDDGHDNINEIGIDNLGFIYFTGTTSSFKGIATVGAYQEDFSYDTMLWDEAYLVKFDPNGNRIWGTYFGGNDYDFGHGLAIDSQNNVIISGNTRSNEKIASVNAHQQNKGGTFDDWDAFLAKFNDNGNLIWSTYYGGNDWEDWGYFKVDVDSSDNIFLIGSTRSTDKIATTGAYQENLSAYSNIFVAKFDQFGKREWGTYYGGNIADYASDIIVSNMGEIYAVGWTFSTTGIASSDGHQEFNAGKKDAFLVKFKDADSSNQVDITEKFLCTGEDLIFNVSGGISYNWSGPNGFVSTIQNPTIQNANINNSGTYVVVIDTGDGCFKTRKFEILISKKPIANPITNLISCEDAFSKGIATNFDTSLIESQIIGNQTAMTVRYFDSSGNELPSPLPNPFKNTKAYIETITARISNDNNLECYSETTFDLIVNPLPDIFSIKDLYECETNNDGFAYFNLEQLKTDYFGTYTNYTVSFYQANGTLISTAELPTYKNATINEETITIKVENIDTNCTNETTFKLIISEQPVVNSLNDIIGCDDNNDGISEYFDTSTIETTVIGNQTGMEVSYFYSNGNPLPSPLPNPFTNTIANKETITVRVTNTQTGCYAETFLNLITSAKPQINQPLNLYACNEGNGIGYFNTTTIQSQLIGNQTGLRIFYIDQNGNELPSPLPSNFQNTTAWSQIIKVKVENELNSLCFSETSFELIVNELPQITLENEYFLCDLEPSLYITTDSTFDSWKWTFEDGSVISNSFEANLVNAGVYTLQVSKINNGIICENSFSFNLIRSNLPKIDEVKIQDISDNNYIEIITSGDGDFEYSIDGFNFQDDNTFHNLLGGIYKIYVRDKKGCGLDEKEVVLVDYPKFFTPNNDGFNDYWQIQAIKKFPNTIIYIFDRFGKLLKQLTFNDFGWDGAYNGQPLSSSDYWFTADLGDGRTFKGHFSLIR